MELKDRKRIVNGKIPKFADGKVDWGNIATSALGTGTAIYDAHQYNTTSDDMMYEAGTDNANIDGIGYTLYNDVNRDKIMSDVNAQSKRSTLTTTLSGATTGALIGSAILPGLGTFLGGGIGAIGGWFGGWLGGKSKKKKAEEQAALAQLKIDNYNEMNRSGALTASLQQKQAEKYGDSRSQLLFGAHEGKPKGLNPGLFMPTQKLVHTADGVVPGIQNSWTGKNEGIWNLQTEQGHLVDEGPNDTAKSYLRDGDRVFGDTENPETGNPAKVDAKPYIKVIENINKNRPKGTGPLGDASRKTYDLATKGMKENAANYLNHLGKIMDNVLYSKYSCGKPKYRPGKPSGENPEENDTKLETDYGLNHWSNIIPSFTGMAAGLGLYIQANTEKPYKPDTFVPNRFLNKGLALLGSLRIDPYGTMQQLREAEGRTNFAITSSGGLSTAQKNLARIASLNNTQQLISNSLNNIQAQNNSYSQHYADLLLAQGLGEAQRQQAAKQYDLEYYSKAHAARQQMKQMGIRNFLDSLNMYSANEFNRKNAIANIKLYADRNDIELAELLNFLNDKEKNQSPTTTNWIGGIPYVIAPEILDKIPGAIQKPELVPQFTPGPHNWLLPKYDWNDITKKYG